MDRDLETMRRMAAALRENLITCADDPDEDSVHNTRTSTRRLQATVNNRLGDLPQRDEGQPVEDAAVSFLRLLKNVRRAASPVRDLDMDRKLLKKLIKCAKVEGDGGNERKGREMQREHGISAPVALETPEAGMPASGMESEADLLDDWLRHRRKQAAALLRIEAGRAVDKLDKRFPELEAALRSFPVRSQRIPAAVAALDAFARLALEMRHLHADNLHDFRKGAKKARYIAELAAHDDTHAHQVAEVLKKLQDEIGDWHDWLLLAGEAHAALAGGATELVVLIEAERDRHLVIAMKTAVTLRGRLMGEWQAIAFSRRKTPRSERTPARRTRASG